MLMTPHYLYYLPQNCYENYHNTKVHHKSNCDTPRDARKRKRWHRSRTWTSKGILNICVDYLSEESDNEPLRPSGISCTRCRFCPIVVAPCWNPQGSHR